MPFTTIYMCKAEFSTVAYLKSKYHNTLQMEILHANLRVAPSSLGCRIDKIIAEEQSHPLHTKFQ